MRLRLLGLLLAAVTLNACGGDSTGPSTTGTLNVRFDDQTCNNGTAEIFVDGTSRGTYFWTAGTPRAFQVEGGTHMLGAQEVGGTQGTWPAQAITVPAGGTFNAVFTC